MITLVVFLWVATRELVKVMILVRKELKDKGNE